jgi:putative membrane protein
LVEGFVDPFSKENSMSRFPLARITLSIAATACAFGAFAQSTQPGASSSPSSATNARGAQSTAANQGASRSSDQAAQSRGGDKSGGMGGSERKFVEKAAAHGLAEVELGKLAAQKASSSEVKQFGQRMVDDHGKANDELKQLASTKGITLPGAPDKAHQRDMDKMSKLSGEQFDREYMQHMVKDHKQDVKDFEKQSKGAKDADLKAFAAKTLPTLQEHLRMAQSTEQTVKTAAAGTRASGERGNNSSNAASRGGTGSGAASK